jgi:hypothetical protein
MLFLLLLLVQGVVLDRVVAIVGGQPIMASDLRAARALGLVSEAVAAPEAASAEGVGDDGGLLDRMVVRELMRAEVDRFSVTLADMERLDRRLAEIRVRAGGASPDAALDRLGMSRGRLRAWLEDDLRIERYLQQRFDVAAQPSDEEVRIYFQSHEREFLRDGQPQPFAAVRDDVRGRLAGERRRALVDEWIAGLRRRAVIVVVPADRLPGA